MFRKSSKSIRKDQNKASFSPLSDALAQKTQSAPIFGVSNLYVRLSTKGLFDLDSSSSPTSALDHKVFSNPGSPFMSSPRSPLLEGHPKSTDCNKVGLGLVDSLDDEVMPLGKVLRCSKSWKVLLGLKTGIDIPGPRTHLDVLCDNASTAAPKSLPDNHRKSLQTPIGSFCLTFGNQNTELESKRLEIHNEDCGNIDRLSMHNNNKFNSEVSASHSKNSTSDSLPIFDDSSYKFIGSLSMSEIEQSEDYTCIISHGPNPRTTRIFGDCILESHIDQSPDSKNKQMEEEDGGESPWEIKSSEELPLYSRSDFLSFCHSCKKKLKEDDDIYIYRGEKAFCSCECRTEEILMEEESDKHTMDSSNSLGSFFHEDIFMEGTAIAK